MASLLHKERTDKPQVAQTHPCYLSQFCVPAQLHVSDQCLSLFVLLDSGWAGNFISQALVLSFTLPMVELPDPITVRALDVHPVNGNAVQHITLPLGLSISNDHFEQNSF